MRHWRHRRGLRFERSVVVFQLFGGMANSACKCMYYPKCLTHSIREKTYLQECKKTNHIIFAEPCLVYLPIFSKPRHTHTHIASKHIIYGSCVSKLCSISSFCFSFPPYPYHPCMVYIYLPLPSFTIKVTTIHVGKYGCFQK